MYTIKVHRAKSEARPRREEGYLSGVVQRSYRKNCIKIVIPDKIVLNWNKGDIISLENINEQIVLKKVRGHYVKI